MKGVLFIELLDFSAKSVDSFLTAIISPVKKKKKKRKRKTKKEGSSESLRILIRLLIDFNFQFITF